MRYDPVGHNPFPPDEEIRECQCEHGFICGECTDAKEKEHCVVLKISIEAVKFGDDSSEPKCFQCAIFPLGFRTEKEMRKIHQNITEWVDNF